MNNPSPDLANARDLATLARRVLLDELARDADDATVRRLVACARAAGDHLLANLDPMRNTEAIATGHRWRRMLAALEVDVRLDDLVPAIERRRQRKRSGNHDR